MKVSITSCGILSPILAFSASIWAVAALALLPIIGGTGISQAATIDDGLVAYWSFASFQATIGGPEYNLTAHGTAEQPTLTDFGPFGASAHFSRADQQYLLSDSSPVPAGSHSYAAWYYLDVDEIIELDRYFVLETTPTYLASYGLRRIGDRQVGQVYVTSGSFTFDSGPHRQWHHIAVTYDFQAERVTGYLDGLEVGSRNYSGLRETSELVIGSYRGKDDRFWQGWITEVAVWDRVLTLDEIQYMQTNPIPESATVALLVFGSILLTRKRRIA